MSHPQPPPEPGDLAWRPWTAEDADTLARHLLRVHEAERLDHVAGPDVLRWLATQPGFDPATDSIAAFDPAGEVRADAGAWAHFADQGARAFLWVDVDPGFEDLRPFLLSWVEARGRERLAEATGDGDRVLRVAVEEHRLALRQAVEAAGFDSQRSFVIMRRPLTGLPPSPPLPDGIEVVPWSETIDERIRQANNEAFQDHWGSLPMSTEAWHGGFAGSDTFRPDLSFAALDGEVVVSYCMVEVDTEDNEQRGVEEVYVSRVGTRRSHRGRRLASLLICRVMETAASGGADTVALDVDETSHTGATAVYARLGFAVESRSIHYLKSV
ncbi:MAG: GNAT family N-acetyltransferase [Acidimicrobiia bacterium]|nr:MAG: GNAT family N-acetyltransferase [Acidimicrobiia bacterium]